MIQALAERSGMFLLSVAAVAWYVASTLVAGALAGGRESPGRRALAHVLVMLPIVVAAIVAGRYEVAVGMIFATSVSCMTLVLGIVIVSAPPSHPGLHRGTWGLLLPLALICMLIGLSGGFKPIHAVILLIEGAALLLLWRAPVASSQSQRPARVERRRPFALLAGLFFAIAAGYAGLGASNAISSELHLPGQGLVTALMLAPALVLSMVGAGLQALHEYDFDHAVGTLVAFVMLNLCAVLPLATALWLTRPHWQAENNNMAVIATTAPATLPAPPKPPVALPYPMSVWRVDTVLLVAVGMLLLPVSLGRWSLGQVEGIGLILAYVAFMAMTAIAAR